LGLFFRIYSDKNTILQLAFSNEAEIDTFPIKKLILIGTLFNRIIPIFTALNP